MLRLCNLARRQLSSRLCVCVELVKTNQVNPNLLNTTPTTLCVPSKAFDSAKPGSNQHAKHATTHTKQSTEEKTVVRSSSQPKTPNTTTCAAVRCAFFLSPARLALSSTLLDYPPTLLAPHVVRSFLKLLPSSVLRSLGPFTSRSPTDPSYLGPLMGPRSHGLGRPLGARSRGSLPSPPALGQTTLRPGPSDSV